MAVKEINPQEAHDLLKAGTGWVYIDVRTVAEFSAGHPESAVNIPVAIPDPGRGMALNENFTQVVQAHFPKESNLLLGCQAGPRSNAAARMLEQAGYQNICNVVGGFGGMRDSSGKVIAPGWSTLGLPVSQDNGENVSYESLAAKAK